MVYSPSSHNSFLFLSPDKVTDNNREPLPATASAPAPALATGLTDEMQEKREDEIQASRAASSDHQMKPKKDGDKKVVVGMFCGKKDLYQKVDKYDKATWTADIPDDLGEVAEDEETEKYALLVRNKKSDDSRKKLEIDSIVIQSPLLNNVLRDVLKDYPRRHDNSLATRLFSSIQAFRSPSP